MLYSYYHPWKSFIPTHIIQHIVIQKAPHFPNKLLLTFWLSITCGCRGGASQWDRKESSSQCLKNLFITEPRAIQEKLLKGASFCSEVNQLIVRCVTPLKSCFDSAGVTEIANALLHDVVPLDKPMLFKNINQGKNCSEIAKQYAAKSGQPILQSTVCK